MTVAVTSAKSPDALVSAHLVTVHEAWKQAAAGRFAPKREEITPAPMKSALPWIWMIDVVDGGSDFRFRIAGDRVIQFLGRRYAGHLLSEFHDQPFFQRMRAIMELCVSRKQPFAAGPVRSNLRGKEFLEMEVVVLPLSEDGRNVTGICGAMDVRPPSGTKVADGATPA
jgi:hypothetical protein